ncbi:MAG: hypothetical protein AAB512_04155 [Patescibacteria group bacterium]
MQEPLSVKTQIEKDVLARILLGLHNFTMTVEAAREIARMTLATVDKIVKHEETVVEFYRDLAKKHKSFEILYTKVKGEILRGQEITAYRDALNLVNEGKIEEANKIAQGALDITANETADA